MSLTERDIKSLKDTTSKGYRLFIFIFFPIATITLLCAGIFNFLLSHRFATMEGLSILRVFEIWWEGISLSQQYSGGLIHSIGRLQSGLTNICFFFVGIFVLLAMRIKISRDARILKFIEENKLRQEMAKKGTVE